MRYAMLVIIFLTAVLVFGRNKDEKKISTPKNESFVPHSFNSTVANVWTKLTNFGLIGDDAFDNPSFEWPGGSNNHHLYQGSIWVAGKDPSGTVHCTAPDEDEITITTDPGDTVNTYHLGDPHFQHRPHVQASLADSQVSAEDTYAEYTDLDVTRHNAGESPLGIKIIERTYKWSESYHYDFIIFDYQIINIGLDTNGDLIPDTPQPLHDVYAGLRFDADISYLAGGEYWYDDMVDFDTLYNISYIFDGDDPDRPGNDTGENGLSLGYVYAHMLNAAGGNPYTVYPEPTSHTWWEINDDPTSDFIKYAFMSTPMYRQKTVAPWDYRFLQSVGPFDMQPNDTINVVWACGVSKGLNGIRYSSIRAKEIYDNYYQTPTNPQPYPPFTVELKNPYPTAYLNWDRTPEPDVASFNIYANGSLLDNISSDSTTYILPSSMTIATPYQFNVTTVWNNGTESDLSDTVNFVYGTPSPVSGIIGIPQDSSASLSWNANPENNITGYNIYRDEQFIRFLSTTTFSDSGLENGIHYSYQITAVNSYSLESEKSAEMVIIPTARVSTGILLVDDYGSNDPLIKSFFENFVVYGFNYTYWNISQMGKPSPGVLENYSSVVWLCGDDTSNKDLYDFTQVTNELRTYLDNGGNLSISGSGALPILTNNIIPAAGDFVYDYLKVKNWTKENSEFYTAKGVNPNFPDLILNIGLAGELNDVAMVNDPDSSINYETNTIYNFGNNGYYWPTPYQDKPCAVFYSSGMYNAVLSNFPLYYMSAEGISHMSRYILTMIFGESYNSNPLPLPPVGLQITDWSETTIDIIWESFGQPGIIGYNIYVATTDNGPYLKINSTPLDSTFYTIDNLNPGSEYFIKLSSVDDLFREGPLSDYVTEIAGRPHPVENLLWTYITNNGVATIQWDVSEEADIMHYKIYVDSVFSFTATDTTAQINTNNQNKIVWVTAVDNLGLESDPSDTLSILYVPTTEYLLVVNGIRHTVYGQQTIDFYSQSMCLGNHNAHIWDLFGDQGVNYQSINPKFTKQFLTGGAIPDTFLFKYHKVIWIGNNYQGDIEYFSPKQILNYIVQRGNFLLTSRYGEDFFTPNLQEYCGISNFYPGRTIDDSYPLISQDANLTNMGPGNGSFSATAADFIDLENNPEITPIFSWFGDGPERIAGFRTHKTGHGEFIYIAGRPYRLDVNASFQNYDYIIENWLGGVLDDINSEKDAKIPKDYVLYQNFPNPFNPVTTVKFGLPKKAEITLTIYNILGQEIKKFDGKYKAGYHEIQWNGLNQYNKKVASGVYIYKFEADEFSKVKKCVFLK